MRSTAPAALLFACVLLCPFTPCVAQSKAPAAGPVTNSEKYKNEALVWERFDTTIRMHADGTGDRTVHLVIRVQSEGAARQFSVISVPYASAYDTATIDFIRVHKPDGTTVETPVADAIEMPAEVTREAPLYSDLKEKQLPVRAIAAGDVLEYQFHTQRTKAEAPGEFWGAEHFLVENGVVLSQTLTLEVPADKYVQVWDPHHPAQPAKHDGVLTYHWESAQLKPTPKPKEVAAKTAAADATKPKDEDEIKDPDEDADGRKLPSVGWTTFHSWAAVGEWYRSLARGRSTPTPAIQARADQLTKDAKTPEDQVRAIYAYVSKTRYVGIDFGVGHYQPHTAEEVMDHEYGDCKDKDTLLESLLRAKGFSTAPALIGVNIAPVADLPSPASFNHVITTVTLPAPTGQIWLDTTAEVAPYRVLVSPIRDEQALVIPDSGAATLEKTPADPPFPYREDFSANAALDKDGLLKSHMEFTVRSDNELGMRMLLRVAPAQWDQAMQYLSGAMGFGGTVSNTSLKQSDLSGPMHITWDYSRPSYADWEHLRILPLFPVLEATIIDKDKAPEHDVDQGAPRTLDATTHIQLPDGYRADLPDAVHVKRDYATFDKTYRLDKNELIVERNVVILKKKVPKADWKDYSAYMKATGLEEGENYISLFPSMPAVPSTSPGTSASSGQTSASDVKKPASAAADAHAQAAADASLKAERSLLAAMMKGVRPLELEGNWDGAQSVLNEIKAKDPTYPYVMSMLGAVALHAGKTDEAIADFNAELANHRETSSNIVVMLANTYVSQKRYEEAEILVRKYLERNDTILFTCLANAQARAGDDAGSLATLQAAMAAHPGDTSIEIPLANTLRRMHRDKEAIAMAKGAIHATQDPNALNSNAYLLSEIKTDLPAAEEASRRSIDIVDRDLSKASIQGTDSKPINESNLLLASWDTLGWILFEEGKATEAEEYVRPAWQNRADLAIGNHLGQILEKEGRPSEALTIDEAALAVAGPSASGDEVAELKNNIARLKDAGVRDAGGDAAKLIVNMHTFQIPNPTPLDGTATVRILIAEDAIQDSYQVDGPREMQPVVASLSKLKMPGVILQASLGQLVRQAAVNCKVTAQTCELVVGERAVQQAATPHSAAPPGQSQDAERPAP